MIRINLLHKYLLTESTSVKTFHSANIPIPSKTPYTKFYIPSKSQTSKFVEYSDSHKPAKLTYTKFHIPESTTVENFHDTTPLTTPTPRHRGQ